MTGKKDKSMPPSKIRSARPDDPIFTRGIVIGGQPPRHPGHTQTSPDALELARLIQSAPVAPDGEPDEGVNMSTRYDQDVRAIWQALEEIQSNVNFVRSELANVTLPDDESVSLTKMLNEFSGLLYDLRTEARNLEDKLGMHPGEPPNDPGICNPDPRATLGFLREWPRGAFISMNAVVEKLQAAMRRDPAVGLAYILVAESASNMLRAYSEILNAIERIDAILGPERNGSTDSNLDPS